MNTERPQSSIELVKSSFFGTEIAVSLYPRSHRYTVSMKDAGAAFPRRMQHHHSLVDAVRDYCLWLSDAIKGLTVEQLAQPRS